MIQCELTPDQLEFVYGLSKQAIQAKLDAGQPFDVDSFMSYLYDRVQKVDSRDRAAQFLAFTPAIIEQVVLNNFTEQVDQIEGYNKISLLKAKWANPETAIENVINALEQTKSDIVIQRKIREKQRGIVKDNNDSKFDYNAMRRYKSVNILSTTLPSYLSTTGKFEPEDVYKDRAVINKIISKISAEVALQDTVTSLPKYQDVPIRLMAVNLGKFTDGTYSPEKLDAQTRKEIARSLNIQKKNPSGVKAGVDQVTDRVIVLVTDDKGNPISFDNSSNIVSEGTNGSTYAYQMMRSIRKQGDTYSIRDIYNLENKVLSSEEIAEIRSTEQGISKAEALKQVNAEFGEYYALRNAALKNDVMLDLIGMTEGVSSEKTGKDFTINELIENDILEKDDIENMRTLSVAEAGYAAGTAVIDVEGGTYEVVRKRISDSMATDLTNVLFSDTLTMSEKEDYINQFIPGDRISLFYKRFEIDFDKVSGDTYVVIYDKTKSKSPKAVAPKKIAEFKIDGSNRLFTHIGNGEYRRVEVQNTRIEFQDAFKNALLKPFVYFNTQTRQFTYKDEAMHLVYPDKLIKDPFSFKTLENGKLVRKEDYFEFIINNNPVIKIPAKTKGFFNKQMLFQRSADTQVVVQNLPVEERVKQLTEEEFLSDFLLNKTAHGPILKDEYKGKLIYATPGLFSQEAFEGTGVLYQNDISVEIIEDLWRRRKNGESKRDFIKAAGFESRKWDFILKPAIKNRVAQLVESGETVVTESLKEMESANLLVLGDRNNAGVQDFGIENLDKYFESELKSVIQYIENIDKAPKVVIKPKMNKGIVNQKAGSTNTSQSNSSKEDGGEAPSGFTLFRGDKFNREVVTKEEEERANEFWNNSATGKKLSKVISLNSAANIVNSDAYANFIINAARLTNTKYKGSINISNTKGSMVDVYHEAFHGFTQLFLPVEEKIALYEEVRNFKNKNGKQPYLNKSYLELEEILAEDFRTYMKKTNVKKDAPKRNSLFRRILNFIKALFGLNAKIKAPVVSEVQLDVLSIPTVKELFENLKIGNPEFLNRYQASIDNSMFFELDRGAKFVNKINNERSKRTALSKQDSDLVTSSMDSIISDILEEQYIGLTSKNKSKDIASKAKGLNLSALLEPSNKAFLYTKVKEKLQNRLGELNKKFTDLSGNKVTSKIETFEDLKNNSIAVLETKSGIHKYVILNSQIDDFKNFNADFKRGERIKGEEWKGISIVGDYYTHASIKDNSVEGQETPAQIIVVSKKEHAQIQFDNYVEGGAKEYTKITVREDAEESDLNKEQRRLQNNIRILETALEQYGDPNYVLNNEAPAGMIAYHLNESIFSIDKVKYEIEEEEEVDEDGEVQQQNQETGEFLNPDHDNFKKSLYDLADKEVVYILKSLHQTGANSVNALGFKKLADFRNTWNTVSTLISGVQSRQEMYDILKSESENFPQIKQLIDFKLPEPEGITSTFGFDISSAFWHTFSRPSVAFWEFNINETNYENIDPATGEVMTVITDRTYVVNESTISLNKIMLRFQSSFGVVPSPYITKSITNPPALNIKKLREDLLAGEGNVLDKNKLKFLKALGFELDNSKKLNAKIKSKELTADIQNLARIVFDLNNVLDKPQNERTLQEKAFINRFASNPIRTLRNEDFVRENLSALPSFKNIEVLRPNAIVRNIADVQSKFGFDTAGESIILPDGERAYTVANHSSVASLIMGINSLPQLTDAYEANHYLSALNPYKANIEKGMPWNHLAERNKILQTLFPNGVKKDKTKNLEVINIAGSQYIKDKIRKWGLTTGDLTATDKLFQSFNMLLSEGIGEFIRHSDKRSAFGLRLNKKRKEFNNIKTGTDPNLWVDIDLFQEGEGESIAFDAFIFDMIANEFDRIQYFSQKENADVLKSIKGYNAELSNGREAGLSFVLSDSLISKEAKERLYELAKDPNITDIADVALNEEIEVNGETVTLYDNIAETTAEYFVQKANSIERKLGASMQINKDFRDFNSSTLSLAYVYNDFINKVEMSNLINGDLAQFKDFTKRVPGSTSDGDGFVSDIESQDFINNIFQKQASTYAKQQGLKDFKFDGTLNTGVIKDPKRRSIYLKEMIAAWQKDYQSREGISAAQAKSKALKDAEPYEKMEEADGAAYLTIDAYRVLRKLGNKWGIEQENLYQDIIANKPIDAAKVKKFFPVYKLHNYGPLMNSKIATTSMYKFAVAPIIPSVAIPGSELHKLHNKMMQDNIQMVTFSSGSKAAYLTKTGSADDIFTKEENEYNKDKFVNEDAVITNNKIHLRYLKDVTSVADKLKNTITVGTQGRVVTLSQLYNMGELADSNKGIANAYLKAVNDLTSVLETQLLDEIGFKYDKNLVDENTGIKGKYVPLNNDSLAKLSRVIRAELNAKGSPIQLQNLIDVNISGQLKIDFSIHPEAEVIEQILSNRISKAISAQKTKGESDVQVPSTFYNGIWDSEYQKELAIKNNNAKIQEVLGTNNLPFYRLVKGKVKLAKIALPFNGDFVNLLNLEYKGEKIGTLKKLNELIKDKDFLNEHGDKVRVTGPRIPTDNTNLIEGFEVWHFIDPAAGNTVVVPTEIVAKAGSDFDVDKLFLSFPNINKDGTLPTEVPNFKAEVEKLRKQNKSVKKLIQQQKAAAQNNLIKRSIDILTIPENYAALTKPNLTYLFTDLLEEGESEVDYSTEHTSLAENPTKFFDAEYDIDQHELLMGGSTPLGMLAKFVKQFIINKSVGAKMPKTYMGGRHQVLFREMRMNFPYNKTKEGNISLSSKLNQDGEDISQILSHGLNGVLDRGNDPFPVKVGITKQSLPVMTRMIESGVSLPIVKAFIKSPTIQRYLKNIVESKGLVSLLTNKNYSKRDIFGKMTGNYIFKNEKALEYNAIKGVNDAFIAGKKLEKDEPGGEFTIKLLGGERSLRFDNLNALNKFVKSQNLKQTDFIYIYYGSDKVFSKPLYRLLEERENIIFNTYHLGEYLWTQSFGKDNFPSAEEIEKGLTKDQEMALLFEFANIESQFSAFTSFQMEFNPDTALLSSADAAISRRESLERFKKETTIDQETLNKLLNSSILSSMYKTEIFDDIISPLFSFRRTAQLKGRIASGVSYFNPEDPNGFNKVQAREEAIKNKYGETDEDKDRFFSDVKNAVTDYIYQNVMSNYTGTNSLPTELPETIRQRKVVKKKLANNKLVNFKSDTVEIDTEQIYQDWENNVFSRPSGELDVFEVSTFPNKHSYLKFIVEREFYRQEFAEFKDRPGFEQRIAKKALSTSFNIGYILGNAGLGSVKYSYTDDVYSFINDPVNADIVEDYPVLQHIKKSFFASKLGYSLLELDNSSLIDNDQAYDYYRQIKRLGDITAIKDPDNAARQQRITELFKDFSRFAIYQQGTGKGNALNFMKAYDPEGFVEAIKFPVINFRLEVLKNYNEVAADEVDDLLRQSDIIFSNIVDSVLGTNDASASYKQLATTPKQFYGLEEDQEIANRLANFSDQGLYDAYENAKEDEELENAMSPGSGTAYVKSIEAELERRGLPLTKEDNTKEKIEKIDGVKLVENALTDDEQLELFEILKPFIQAQGAKTNKGKKANIMIGLNVRWDYVVNNPNYKEVDISKIIDERNRGKYAYYEVSINGEPLGPISPRIKELMAKATGIDTTNYDGAIINLYDAETFVSAHTDTSEAADAIGYPVLVANLGGKGNISIEGTESRRQKRDYNSKEYVDGSLNGGDAYIFGLDGVNRDIYHRTLADPIEEGIFPELTINNDNVNITYPAGSYRITVTMRRVMPIEGTGIPSRPGLAKQAPVSNDPAEYTNHAGGARGYDTEWDLEGENFGMVNNKHYLLPSDGPVSDPRLRAKGVEPVDATNDVGPIAKTGPATGEGQIAVTNAERTMGRIESNYTTRNTKKIRNYAQVKNADGIFAIGSLIPKGADITVARGKATKKALVPQVNGGTSVAVQLGITMGKPTYVFNQVANDSYPQGWYKWDNAKQDFVSISTPTLTKNFAGIGTSSNTTEAGKQAIRDVYENTFGKPTTKVEISSDAKGLAAALTNPTELAKKKGNLKNSYPITYNGKTYVDVEAAYQELKDKSEAKTKPSRQESKNYELMVNLIATKFEAYPSLVEAIIKEGGSKWLSNATHQPTKKNTVWETGGENWFIAALVDAYGMVEFDDTFTDFDQADVMPSIQQNFKDGDGGRKMQEKYKGKSTMDLVKSGIRTRTTRSKTEVNRMIKDYNLDDITDLTGMVIRMTDKEGNQVYTRITAVKVFTKEYQDQTWQKEGWEKSVTDKLLGKYPYAIEFTLTSRDKEGKGLSSTLFDINPILDSWYRSLTKKELDSPELPSLDEAQEIFDEEWDGSIESFIEELKCKIK